MKRYEVWYIIKKNGHGILSKQIVYAANRKKAIQNIRDHVRHTHDRHAFHISFKPPVKNAYGVEYDGMTYTKAGCIGSTMMLW